MPTWSARHDDARARRHRDLPLDRRADRHAGLIDPPGEARDDYAILAGMAERFGVAERYTEGLDTDGWLRRIWEESTVRGRATGVDLPPYEELWEKQVIELPRPKEPA